MKKIFFLSLVFLAFSCKNDAKTAVTKEAVKTVDKENFPEELGKVFKMHGGINTWKNARTLSFNKGEEVHTTDLKTRQTVVNHPNYALGFDGKEVWIKEEKKGSFKSNPTFYYNLYFYFYAMPFVLADDGILYEKVNAISFKGIDYPGFKISYQANVGTSPDDNYIIYYHPETFKMEWLAYTVTFTSKKPSEKYNLIKYDTWVTVDGLILPKEIVWYKKDDKGNPTEPARPATEFTLPFVSKTKMEDSFFQRPEN